MITRKNSALIYTVYFLFLAVPNELWCRSICLIRIPNSEFQIQIHIIYYILYIYIHIFPGMICRWFIITSVRKKWASEIRKSGINKEIRKSGFPDFRFPISDFGFRISDFRFLYLLKLITSGVHSPSSKRKSNKSN